MTGTRRGRVEGRLGSTAGVWECGSAWTRDAYEMYMFIGWAWDDDEVQRCIDTRAKHVTVV